jgi:uncharacterized protein GlcG (DUF336 family)
LRSVQIQLGLRLHRLALPIPKLGIQESSMSFRTAIAAAVACTLATGVHAQADRPAPNFTPMSEQSMAGDYFDIPQSAQLKVPLGPPAGPRQGGPQPARPGVPGPGLALAVEAAQAAEASCQADGYTVTVAVADSAGNLNTALAPDGVRPNGIYMAIHKTATVVGFRISTLELRARIERDPALLAQVKPNMSLLPGGLPIFKGQQFVGAIATSGASAHEEEKCAADGIARIQSRL